MSRWSIDPSGVAGVLKQVDPHAQALGDALGDLEGALTAAVTGTQSPAISDAVGSYLEQVEGPRITSMSTRIQAAAAGVVNATTAYVDGDLEMAGNAQRAAVEAVYPPELSMRGGPTR